VVAALVWARRGPASSLNPLPDWNWHTLQTWSVISFALSGLEVAGLMGGEIRKPERTVVPAAWISSLFAALFYIACTLALLVLLKPARSANCMDWVTPARLPRACWEPRGSRPRSPVLVVAERRGCVRRAGLVGVADALRCLESIACFRRPSAACTRAGARPTFRCSRWAPWPPFF
jgi:hypothetical protein